jgi:hypothetical protein
VRDLKRYADVKRLRGLPSNRNPLIVFLGSPPSGTSAVFLVDSERFSVSGEGNCSPSGDRCTFLRLRASNDRNDAVLTDLNTGATYRLRLTAIKRVAINSSAGSRSTEGRGGGGGRGGGNRTPAFTGSAGGSGSAPPLPYFADGASG